MNEKSNRLQKVLNILKVLAAVVIILAIVYLYRMGYLTEPEKLQAVIRRSGWLAPFVFMLFLIIRPFIPVIPATVLLPIGALLFGKGKGFVYAVIGSSISGVLVYLIGRKYGLRLIKNFLPKKTLKQIFRYLKHEKLVPILELGLFIPILPADILCYVAGTSKQSFLRYTTFIILSKMFVVYLLIWGTGAIFDALLKLVGS